MRAELPSLFELLADKLAERPELMAVARENCARWTLQGHGAPQRLREWDALLREAQVGSEGMKKLRVVLLSSDEASARLRDFHPFAGILSREERRQARELCGYRH